MTHDPHHQHLIKEVAEIFKPILSKSPQAIYIYLDDEHKICNKKYADMLGYKSVAEWVKNPYPVDDVLEKDQKKGIKAYLDASEKFKLSMAEGALVRKNGKKIKVVMHMVPFTYKGEVFVIHFFSKQ